MDSNALEARMRATAHEALSELRDRLLDMEPRVHYADVGRVVAVGDGVARVVGLESLFAGEPLRVGRVMGIAEELREDEVRVVLLGPSSEVQAGDTVRRTSRTLDVPVGRELIGRVVDPLGRPLDVLGPVATSRRMRVHPPVTPLADREPVARPLRTGVFSVDTMIPIGRGQRQLVIGDRSTGKSELGLDVLAAMDEHVIGVYVAIGRRGSETAASLEWLKSRAFFNHGFAVVSDADDPPGLVHLTPYSACSMAEHLAAAGHDVVIVYDDLSVHANVHRTLALLLGRPVGREAHPVDVFYAHARLLERATQFSEARGGGSLTAFPIVETLGGDLSAYIPTNIVSITDGQIRLDADLVAAGMTPAVDIALSVSRVGGKAQPALVRRLSGSFKNRFAQFLELESFARFGTRLEASAQAVVDWGRRVRALLKQERGTSSSWSRTVARLLIADMDELVEVPEEVVAERIEHWIDAVVKQPEFEAAAIGAGELGAGELGAGELGAGELGAGEFGPDAIGKLEAVVRATLARALEEAAS